MKIAVVGAGAMGSFFGAMLARSGQDVWLIDKRAEHVQSINTQGLRIVENTSETIVKIKATTDITDVAEPDLILFFVKSYDTEQAAQDCCKIMGENTIIVTLQNGLGNTDKLAGRLGHERIVAGTTSYGCTTLNPGVIRVSNVGEVTIGELDGSSTVRLQQLIEVFGSAGIKVKVSESIEGLIWTKLAVNAGINALTAITLLKNGELLEYDETMQLMRKVVSEVIEVANRKGIRFLVADPLQLVMDIAKDTYHNKSSMRQDIERGARTEIDSINGAVVLEGAKVGMVTPVNEVLTLLVKSLEKKDKRTIIN